MSKVNLITINKEDISIDINDVKDTFFEGLLNTSLDKTIDSKAHKALTLITTDYEELIELTDMFILDKNKLFEFGLNLISLSNNFLKNSDNINFDVIYDHIIENKINPNLKNQNNENILLYLSKNYLNIKKIIKLLNNNYNFDYNLKDINGNTFVHYIFDSISQLYQYYNHNLDYLYNFIIMIINNKTFNINSIGNNGTVFHYLCNSLNKLLNNNNEATFIKKIMFEITKVNNFDPNIKDLNNNTILHLLSNKRSSKFNNIDLIIYILNNFNYFYNSKNIKGNTIIYQIFKTLRSNNIVNFIDFIQNKIINDNNLINFDIRNSKNKSIISTFFKLLKFQNDNSNIISIKNLLFCIFDIYKNNYAFIKNILYDLDIIFNNLYYSDILSNNIIRYEIFNNITKNIINLTNYDLNSYNNNSSTLLHIIIDFYIKFLQSNINPSYNNSTFELIEFLLINFNIDVNLQNIKGDSYLHLLIKSLFYIYESYKINKIFTLINIIIDKYNFNYYLQDKNNSTIIHIIHKIISYPFDKIDNIDIKINNSLILKKNIKIILNKIINIHKINFNYTCNIDNIKLFHNDIINDINKFLLE